MTGSTAEFEDCDMIYGHSRNIFLLSPNGDGMDAKSPKILKRKLFIFIMWFLSTYMTHLGKSS